MSESKSEAKKYEPKMLGYLEHDRQMFHARYNGDGSMVAAGGYDGSVHVWKFLPQTRSARPEKPKKKKKKGPDILPAKKVEPIAGHQGWVTTIAWHPKKPFLFSGDSWGQLRLQDETRVIWSVKDAHEGWLRDLSVSSDGKRVATCGTDDRVRLWDASTGKPIGDLGENHHGPFRLIFSPDGRSLYVGDQFGTVRRWSLDGTFVSDPVVGGVSKQKVTSEVKPNFPKYDAKVLYKYHRIQEVGGVRCLALNSEGSILLVGGTQPVTSGNVTGIPTVLAFDTASGKLLHQLELGTKNDVYVWDLALHSEGFLMAVTSGQPGTGKVVLQRLNEKTPFFETKALANCHSLSLHPSGRQFAVTSTNKGSNGNGRRLNQAGEYEGNRTPIHIFDLVAQ